MAINKARAQTDKHMTVFLKILDTAGTPTVVNISPSGCADDVSITDTGTGIYDIVIKNMKGPRGLTNIMATPYTTSLMAAVSARSYSSDDLSITIRVEDDASALTDSSVDVRVEAF